VRENTHIDLEKGERHKYKMWGTLTGLQDQIAGKISNLNIQDQLSQFKQITQQVIKDATIASQQAEEQGREEDEEFDSDDDEFQSEEHEKIIQRRLSNSKKKKNDDYHEEGNATTTVERGEEGEEGGFSAQEEQQHERPVDDSWDRFEDVEPPAQPTMKKKSSFFFSEDSDDEDQAEQQNREVFDRQQALEQQVSRFVIYIYTHGAAFVNIACLGNEQIKELNNKLTGATLLNESLTSKYRRQLQEKDVRRRRTRDPKGCEH